MRLNMIQEMIENLPEEGLPVIGYENFNNFKLSVDLEKSDEICFLVFNLGGKPESITVKPLKYSKA